MKIISIKDFDNFVHPFCFILDSSFKYNIDLSFRQDSMYVEADRLPVKANC